MPQITITFTNPINASCQVGDKAYYVDTSSSGGFTVNSSNITEIGFILQINGARTQMICDTTLPGSLNGTNKFILFGKSNSANLSSILGYYAEVKFVCDDTTEAEIYQTGITIFESSGNNQGM